VDLPSAPFVNDVFNTRDAQERPRRLNYSGKILITADITTRYSQSKGVLNIARQEICAQAASKPELP
jgi:hypothetical protein